MRIVNIYWQLKLKLKMGIGNNSVAMTRFQYFMFLYEFVSSSYLYSNGVCVHHTFSPRFLLLEWVRARSSLICLSLISSRYFCVFVFCFCLFNVFKFNLCVCIQIVWMYENSYVIFDTTETHINSQIFCSATEKKATEKLGTKYIHPCQIMFNAFWISNKAAYLIRSR